MHHLVHRVLQDEIRASKYVTQQTHKTQLLVPPDLCGGIQGQLIVLVRDDAAVLRLQVEVLLSSQLQDTGSRAHEE